MWQTKTEQGPRRWAQQTVKETQQPSTSTDNAVIASTILKSIPHLPLKYQAELNQK